MHHTTAAAVQLPEPSTELFSLGARASLAASQDTTQRQLLPNSFHYVGSISLDKRSKQRTGGGFTVLLHLGSDNIVGVGSKISLLPFAHI